MGLIKLAFYSACFFTLFSILVLAYGLSCHDWSLIVDSAGLSVLGLFASSLLARVSL